MIEKLESICSGGIPSVTFPSEEKWGIPLLKSEYEADFIDLPFTQWGTRARSKAMLGTYSFYVDDYRFNALWKHPEQVVNSGCISAIEPNISISSKSPKAYALAAIFCKRWVARYWQSEGIRIFVDMNVPEEFSSMNLLGVPPGWRAYSTHGYVNRIEALKSEHKTACNHAGTKDILWIVYGGGKEVRNFCLKKGWTHIPEQFDMEKGKFTDVFSDNIFVKGRERGEGNGL